jgi:hypothetical protein
MKCNRFFQHENFDYYSPEDIAVIKQTTDEMDCGERVSFSSGRDAARYFGIGEL